MLSEQRNRTTILDYGYIECIETWGSDERIVEAARMSTDKGFKGWVRLIQCTVCGLEWECENIPAVCNHGDCYGKNSPTIQIHAGDAKLLRYLYAHKHFSPFEMAGMIIEVQAPIMVFREWHRHRTQSYNELSARYTELPNLFYVPSIERLQASKQHATSKQSSDAGFTTDEAKKLQASIQASYTYARIDYDALLKLGVAREVARLIIPVAQYSRMRASANLRNWLAFLTLRMAPNAQYEIRMYANEVAKLIQQHFPRTYELFIHDPH